MFPPGKPGIYNTKVDIIQAYTLTIDTQSYQEDTYITQQEKNVGWWKPGKFPCKHEVVEHLAALDEIQRLSAIGMMISLMCMAMPPPLMSSEFAWKLFVTALCIGLVAQRTELHMWRTWERERIRRKRSVDALYGRTTPEES